MPGAGKISRASCIFSTRFTPTGWEPADGGPWNRLLCPRSIRSGFQPRPLVVRYAHAANFYILFRPQFFLSPLPVPLLSTEQNKNDSTQSGKILENDLASQV